MQNESLKSKNSKSKDSSISNRGLFQVYQLLFTKTDFPLFIYRDKHIIDCNNAFASLLSLSRNNLIQISIDDIFPKYQPDGKLSSKKWISLLTIAQKRPVQELNWLFSHENGSTFLGKVSMNAFLYEGDYIYSISIADSNVTQKEYAEIGLNRDAKLDAYDKLNEEFTVTVKYLSVTNDELIATNKELNKIIKKYEQEKKITSELQNLLQSSQLKLKNFIAQSADGLAIVDSDALIVEWNQKMTEITGVDFAYAIFKKIYDIEFECIPKANRTPQLYKRIKKDTLSYINNSTQNDIKQFEGRLETKNGLIKFISITIFPIKSDKNQSFGYIIKDISVRKKQEKELAYYQKHLEDLVAVKTEEVYEISHQFNEIFNNSSDNIFLIHANPEGNFLFTKINNQGLKEFNLIEKELFLPINIDRLLKHESFENLKTNLEKCIKFKEPISFEENKSYPNPKSTWSTTLIPLKDKNGECRNIAGFSRNISFAKQVEEVEEFIANIYKSSLSIILVLDQSGKIISLNNEFEHLTGYNINELKQFDYREFPIFLNEDQILFKGYFERIATQEIDSFDFYANLKTKDGQLKWVYIKSSCKRGKNGELLYLIATGIDLTERKQFELMLQENEEQYSSLFETMNDALVIIDPVINSKCEVFDFTIIDFNPIFVEFIGEKPEMLVGCLLSNLFYQENNELMNQINQVYKSGTSSKYDGYNNKIKKYFSSSVFKPRKGHIAIIFRDVTKQRKVENELIASEIKFRNIFESSEDGIAIISQNFVLVQGNPALQKMLDATDEQFYNGTIFDNIPTNYHEIVTHAIQEIFNQKSITNLEIELVGFNGKKFSVELSARLILYEGENAILTIIRDVSERKTMEKVLLNAIIETEERERRRLAGDLHDEMGPILASLRMYISILQQKNKEPEQIEILGIMSNLTKNSIENIRTISNNISPHLIERYGLASAINAEVDNLRLLLPISFDTNLTGIKLSRNVEITYYRIIKELINNTIKYAKAKSASIYLYFENEYLSLSYSDDGIGIDLEAVEQEKNKGLGLFNIVNRIKSIDGEFSYNTSYGKGFNFTLKTKTTLR